MIEKSISKTELYKSRLKTTTHPATGEPLWVSGRPSCESGINMDKSGNVSIRKAARRDDKYLDSLWKEVGIMFHPFICFVSSFFLVCIVTIL